MKMKIFLTFISLIFMIGGLGLIGASFIESNKWTDAANKLLASKDGTHQAQLLLGVALVIASTVPLLMGLLWKRQIAKIG